MNTLFDLTGRKAIVTGAAQGLAYSMAEGLMESGAEVAVIDISDRTVEVAREFCGRGFRCHGIQADLSRIDELEGVFSRAVDALGGLDIIVNGAGVQRRYRSEEFPTEEWDFVINVNQIPCGSCASWRDGISWKMEAARLSTSPPCSAFWAVTPWRPTRPARAAWPS